MATLRRRWLWAWAKRAGFLVSGDAPGAGYIPWRGMPSELVEEHATRACNRSAYRLQSSPSQRFLCLALPFACAIAAISTLLLLQPPPSSLPSARTTRHRLQFAAHPAHSACLYHNPAAVRELTAMAAQPRHRFHYRQTFSLLTVVCLSSSRLSREGW